MIAHSSHGTHSRCSGEIICIHIELSKSVVGLGGVLKGGYCCGGGFGRGAGYTTYSLERRSSNSKQNPSLPKNAVDFFFHRLQVKQAEAKSK